MPKIKYKDFNFRAGTLGIIKQAQEEQDQHRATLGLVAEKWDEVAEFVNGEGGG